MKVSRWQFWLRRSWIAAIGVAGGVLGGSPSADARAVGPAQVDVDRQNLHERIARVRSTLEADRTERGRDGRSFVQWYNWNNWQNGWNNWGNWGNW